MNKLIQRSLMFTFMFLSMPVVSNDKIQPETETRITRPLSREQLRKEQLGKAMTIELFLERAGIVGQERDNILADPTIKLCTEKSATGMFKYVLSCQGGKRIIRMTTCSNTLVTQQNQTVQVITDTPAMPIAAIEEPKQSEREINPIETSEPVPEAQEQAVAANVAYEQSLVTAESVSEVVDSQPQATPVSAEAGTSTAPEISVASILVVEETKVVELVLEDYLQAHFKRNLGLGLFFGISCVGISGMINKLRNENKPWFKDSLGATLLLIVLILTLGWVFEAYSHNTNACPSRLIRDTKTGDILVVPVFHFFDSYYKNPLTKEKTFKPNTKFKFITKKPALEKYCDKMNLALARLKITESGVTFTELLK